MNMKEKRLIAIEITAIRDKCWPPGRNALPNASDVWVTDNDTLRKRHKLTIEDWHDCNMLSPL